MSRAIILLVALVVVRGSTFFSAKKIEAMLKAAGVQPAAPAAVAVSSAPSLRSAERKLAVTQYLYVQDACSSAVEYTYVPVDTCIGLSTAYIKITSASQSGTTTAFTFGFYSDSACATLSTSSAYSLSSTCGTQTFLSSSISSFSIVSSISQPNIAGSATAYYSDSACSTMIGFDTSTLDSCAKSVSTSTKATATSSVLVTSTEYTTTDCSGTGTASLDTITTTCTLATTSDGIFAGSYYKDSITSATTTDSTTCFAGSESVQLESGSMKQISEVSVGDVVLSADSHLNMKYSPVIAVPHKTNDIETSFSNIKFVDERDIMMTPEHLILAGSCGSNALGLMAAKKVAPGMCVVDSENKQVEVVSNDMKTSKGLYTIVTNEEYVVINGFVASPFAYNHFVANNFYNVYRMAVKSMPLLFQSQFFMAGFHAFAGLVMSV